jgi:hypothetical protein
VSTRLVDIPEWARTPIRAPLDEVRSDAERRERGVSLDAWNRAPRPPALRALCEQSSPEAAGDRPCRALRCWFHCGVRGNGRMSCVLDVERPMSHAEIADVLGLDPRSVKLTQAEALSRARESTPDDVLKALRIRRRPKGQTSGT